MTLPNFLVIGAGRSGTTSLHHYLGQHPDIFLPSVKEPNYFSLANETNPLNDRRDYWLLQNSVVESDAYEALFDAASGETALGEVTPSYLHHPHAPQRITELIPDIKLIAILRNPVDRAYASYISRLGNGWETRTEFGDAIQEEERRIRENVPLGIYNNRNVGNYATHLNRYFDLFHRGQIRIYVFEEFICDSQTVLRDIFSFLGVDNEFRPDTSTRHNPSALIRNPVLRQLWRRSTSLRQWVRPFFSVRVRHSAFQWLHRHTYKPTFPAELRSELAEYYRPEIKELERLLDRDLSLWSE